MLGKIAALLAAELHCEVKTLLS